MRFIINDSNLRVLYYDFKQLYQEHKNFIDKFFTGKVIVWLKQDVEE